MRTAVCGTINRAADGAEFGSRLADGQEAHARQNGGKKKGKPKHGWRQLEAAGEASGKGRNENQARRGPRLAADESASELS